MVKKRYSPRTKGEYLKGSLLCNFQPRADKAEREEEKPHHSRFKDSAFFVSHLHQGVYCFI